MIRDIVEVDDQFCEDVDVTFENGLAHSVLRPMCGLVWDLVHTARHVGADILTARHMGYNKKAMVVSHGPGKGATVMLNPALLGISGRKHYTKITLSYYDAGGRNCTVKLKSRPAQMIMSGLEILGVERERK